jgi:hypothetical protein
MQKKPIQAAWKLTCKPKKQGGLGVLDLAAQNEALLMKNLHKFFNRINISWVNIVWNSHYWDGAIPFLRKVGSFWWRDVLKTMNTYKGFSRVIIEDGRTTRLWLDQWDNRVPEVAFRELFSFVMNKDITMRQAKDMEYPQNMFHTPMSETTHEQYQILIESLQRQ